MNNHLKKRREIGRESMYSSVEKVLKNKGDGENFKASVQWSILCERERERERKQ